MNQEPGRPESPRPSTPLSRRRLLQLAGVAGLAAAAGPYARTDRAGRSPPSWPRPAPRSAPAPGRSSSARCG